MLCRDHSKGNWIMKSLKWERLESGLYSWITGNSQGDYMIWVERGCGARIRYPSWYWTVVSLSKEGLANKRVGSEISLIEAKACSLGALHRMIEEAFQCLNGGEICTGNL